MLPPASAQEPGAFALARRSLRAAGARPQAALLLGVALLGVELVAGLLLSKLCGPRVLLDLLLGEPPRATAIAALLAAALPLAALTGAAAALALAWVEERSLSAARVAEAGVTSALALLGAFAGVAAVAAGATAAFTHGVAGQSLRGALLFALGAGPGLLVVGASGAAALLSLGRIGRGEDACSLGGALADLLRDPPRSAGRLGALLLCALPFLVLALLAGGAGLLSGLPAARLGLLAAQSLSSGFALLWLADGARRVIARTPDEGSLGATGDRC